MIIELFGPPGAGKTTCADRLAADLRRKGMQVELVLSHRPAEIRGLFGDRAAFLRRLMRAAGHLSYIIVSSRPGASWRLVRQLLSLLPQNSILRAFRLGQYLVRLDHSWRRARASSHVVIFDQAFLQAVYTLAAQSPAGAGPIAEAIDLLPPPDLAIFVEAGLPAVTDRLRTRSVRQSPLERLLDADAHVFANDFTILEAIAARLASLSRDVIPLKGEGELDLTPIHAAIAKHMAVEKGVAENSPPQNRTAGSVAAGESNTSPGGSAARQFVSRMPLPAACMAALAGALTLFGTGLKPASGPRPISALAGSDAAVPVKVSGGLDPGSAGTPLHFASGGNFDRVGNYSAGKYGFNLVDIRTAGQLDRLPSGVRALAWVGLCRIPAPQAPEGRRERAARQPGQAAPGRPGENLDGEYGLGNGPSEACGGAGQAQGARHRLSEKRLPDRVGLHALPRGGSERGAQTSR